VKTRFILLGLLCAANLALADMIDKVNARQSKLRAPDAAWQADSLPLPTLATLQPQWIELAPPVTVKQRLFIDSSSLQLAADRSIRYALRQVSSSGIDNISWDGLQCNERTQRSFAFADQVGQRWIESQRADWRRLDGNNDAQQTVAKSLCSENSAPLTVEELRDNLKRAAKR
jgi:hypothetical protein